MLDQVLGFIEDDHDCVDCYYEGEPDVNGMPTHAEECITRKIRAVMIAALGPRKSRAR